MANANTKPSDLSPEQYSTIFREAQHFKMIPYEYRVWDRYLYSKCPWPDDAVILRDVHVWLMRLKHTPITIGEWCVKGKFVENAHNYIKNSNNKYGDSGNILRFLEQHEAVLATPLSSNTTLGNQSTELWLAQGRACVKAGKPNENQSDPDVNAKWIKKRNAYFVFGVIVWGALPDPVWVLEDINLDTYFDMGFPVAHNIYLNDQLSYKYMDAFRGGFIKGATQQSFEHFYTFWCSGALHPRFEQWEETESVFIENLRTFWRQKANGQEPESIWRLSHLLSMGSENYSQEKIDKDVIIKRLFGTAWTDYRLHQIGDSNKDIKERRTQYWQCLRFCENPMELHRRMQAGDWEGVRAFAREADEANGKHPDSRRLALL